jgi:hypothetical protein
MKTSTVEFVKGTFPSNDKLIEFMEENHIDVQDLCFFTSHANQTVKKWVTSKSKVQMWRVIEIINKLTEKI